MNDAQFISNFIATLDNVPANSFRFYRFQGLLLIQSNQDVYLCLNPLNSADRLESYFTEKFKQTFKDHKIHVAFLTEKAKVIIYEIKDIFH
jgi:hypothetical protein